MSERLTIRVCMFLAVIYMVIAWVFLDSIPAQVLPQSLSPESIAKAKVGDVLKREGNTETRKAADNKLTAKVYTTEQWDANGKSLLTRDEDTGKITARKRYVKYVPDETTAKLKCERVVGNAAIKENWIVPDATVKRLVWTIETDAPSVEWDGNRLKFYDTQGALLFVTEPPVAWDADKKPVGIEVTYWENVLSYDIIGDKYAYPVTVDPTTTATVGSGLAGYTYSDKSGSYVSSVYTDAKDETVGSASYTGYGLSVGQYASGGEGCTSPGCPRVIIYRSFIALPGAIAGMATVSACTLFVDGGNDYTATDFDIKMYGARSWKSTLTTADFSRFHGWGTTNLTGTNLIETWNTSSYSSGLNALVLNAAGRDSLLAASGDTLWVALASSRDASYQTPTLNTMEHIEFTGPGGSGPYWSYTYTLAYSQTTRTTPYDKAPNYLWNNGAIIPIWKP